jgi:hypothetical protein
MDVESALILNIKNNSRQKMPFTENLCLEAARQYLAGLTLYPPYLGLTVNIISVRRVVTKRHE